MENQEEIWDYEYKQNNSKWRRERHSIPKVLKNKVILEIGVGNGKNLAEIINQRPKLVSAIDSSKQAILICKRKFNQRNIKFVQRNIINSGFADEAFDVILCYYVLNNLLEKDRKLAVKEMHRILRKGGVLIFEDFMRGDLRQEKSGGNIIEKNTIMKKNGIICHFFSKAEVRKLFKKFKVQKLSEKRFKVVLKQPKLKRKLVFMQAKK
ncbi:MAG TPA: class I SAM-dependent methyltransferase [Candidatus Nanoarchaeia archaeon]|nr:class I SAM-dependent methyltransferase [Candidatus Nanoarchaeia archaeon]